ncbi:hypothetical protein ACC713_38360, partial [Rhizobium johnstonii]
GKRWVQSWPPRVMTRTPFDPMPSRVEHCLALLKPTVPVGPDWLYEVKLDGYRLAIHVEPKGVRVITRGG